MLKVKTLRKNEMEKIYELLDSKDVQEEYKRRLKIILFSAEGWSAPDITPKVNLHPFTVRKWIKVYNQRGLSGLLRKPKGGAPPTFTKEQRQKIIKIALSRPCDLGLPFTNWSLSKLRDYLVQDKVVKSISLEMLRIILNRGGIKFKKMKTYMRSNDPNYELKKTAY